MFWYADIIQVLGTFFRHLYSSFRICILIGFLPQFVTHGSVCCLANRVQSSGRDACIKEKPTFLVGSRTEHTFSGCAQMLQFTPFWETVIRGCVCRKEFARLAVNRNFIGILISVHHLNRVVGILCFGIKTKPIFPMHVNVGGVNLHWAHDSIRV